MTNNKRLLIYGSSAAIFLTVVITIIFINLFSAGRSEKKEKFAAGGSELCRAIPSDAVVIFDIKETAQFIPMLEDTSSFAYKLVDEGHPISQIQRRLSNNFPGKSLPLAFSLHYSSKNDVSLLAISDISAVSSGSGKIKEILPFLQGRKKRYNTTDIHTFNDSLNVALCDGLLVMRVL